MIHLSKIIAISPSIFQTRNMEDPLESTRRGMFGYENLDGCFVPYIYRHTEKYCAYAVLLRHIEWQEINFTTYSIISRCIKCVTKKCVS